MTTLETIELTTEILERMEKSIDMDYLIEDEKIEYIKTGNLPTGLSGFTYVKEIKELNKKYHSFHTKEEIVSKCKLTGWDNTKHFVYSLSYHYNKVYLNKSEYYNNVRKQSCTKPFNKENDKADLKIITYLLSLDKAKGFINKDYQL